MIVRHISLTCTKSKNVAVIIFFSFDERTNMSSRLELEENVFLPGGSSVTSISTYEVN
jgi:hypothetical protein